MWICKTFQTDCMYTYIPSIFSIYAIIRLHSMSFKVMYTRAYSVCSTRLWSKNQISLGTSVLFQASKMPKSNSLQSAFSVILPLESKSSGAMYLPNDSLDSKAITGHFNRPVPNWDTKRNQLNLLYFGPYQPIQKGHGMSWMDNLWQSDL